VFGTIFKTSFILIQIDNQKIQLGDSNLKYDNYIYKKSKYDKRNKKLVNKLHVNFKL